MKGVVLTGVMIGGMLAGPAMAADLSRADAPAVKAPAVVPTPVFSWTGFYIGANAGYGWGSGDGLPGSLGADPQGWVGGGQAGYNYQFDNNVVAGVEADLQGGDISAEAGGLSSTLNTLGTVRGRLGYAAGRVMPYVTGGLAWGNNSLDYLGLDQSKTHVGWTAGAGVEYALSEHWTAKTEYQYTDLGSKFYDALGADAGVTAHTAKVGVNFKF